MFNSIIATEPTAGLEDLSVDVLQLSSVDATTEPGAPAATPDAPKPRFGAVRIPLEEDGWDSKIRIIERQNIHGTNDYLITLNGAIPTHNRYFAEAITLLRTIGEKSTILINIASGGGSLHTGAALAGAIKDCKAKVITNACGIVASAAALIWSYGHERLVEDQAVILFHMSSHLDYGNSVMIQQNAEHTVRYVKEIAIDPMVEQGLLTIEEAETLIDKRQDVLIAASVMRARLEKHNA